MNEEQKEESSETASETFDRLMKEFDELEKSYKEARRLLEIKMSNFLFSDRNR